MHKCREKKLHRTRDKSSKQEFKDMSPPCNYAKMVFQNRGIKQMVKITIAEPKLQHKTGFDLIWLLLYT